MIKNGTKKNVNTRKLIISNYRNVGITYEKGDKPAELVVNRSIETNELGDLVFLVGPNNSGKSNVLAALEAFSSRRVNEDDHPDFMYCDMVPEIVMKITHGNLERSQKLSFDKDKKKSTKTRLETELESLESGLKKTDNEMKRLTQEQKEIQKEESSVTLNKNEVQEISSLQLSNSDILGLKKYLEEHKNDDDYYYHYGREQHNEVVEKRIRQLELKEKLSVHDKKIETTLATHNTLLDGIEKKKDEIEEANSLCLSTEGNDMPEYDYLLSSKVVTYKQRSISQADLSSKPDNPSDFIKNVLLIMGRKKDTLENIYSRFEAKHQKSYLRKFAEELNKDIPKMITNLFNKMYYCNEGEEYRFEFDMDADRLYISLYRGDVPIDLDKQSTGFRWFFDFFFNFVNKEELKPGDIVIMDEPATNLHVSGQIELRDFLKELAKKNGITFVISTHSPFLVSCDYLDELRLMVRDKRGYIMIGDKFNLISDGADKLDPVLKGLTVGRHILIDPMQKVIFTEGITDYDYLTAFKILYSREDEKYTKLTFLPVDGVKNDKLLDELAKIDRNPILLVDYDGPGKEIQKKSEGTCVNVVSLADVDGGKNQLKTIEDLFTAEDREHFNIYDKDWNCASTFKRNILENEGGISDTTKKRFRDALNWLLDV